MKKAIIISLSICAMIFFIGGVFLITKIQDTTSKQNNLIMLHQVEILRETLLTQMRKTQADMDLRNTRYARSTDTIVKNVVDLETILSECFNCHHNQGVFERLIDLREKTELYKSHISRILTIRSNNTRQLLEEERAFHLADDIMNEINTMVHFTSSKLEKRTDSILDDIKITKTALYTLIILTPFFVAFVSYLFGRQLTQPIKTLLEATRKLKGGNLDHRVPALKYEFGEVATSFNEMATSLKEQILNMQRAEQMVIIGELAAGLAHEIKNPLSGIKVTLELLTEDANISEHDRDIGARAIEKINQIELLLKSLLNFAKPPTPQFITTDINKVLEKIVEFAKKYPAFSSGEQSPIEVTMDLGDSVPKILADQMQLEQAFLNLILNAADAMPEGGTLKLKTEYDEKKDMVDLEISDTGTGIEKYKTEDIFKPFFTTKPRGTGLGLAVTKRFIEQNKGQILVESVYGEGTTFKISLPVNKTATY